MRGVAGNEGAPRTHRKFPEPSGRGGLRSMDAPGVNTTRSRRNPGAGTANTGDRAVFRPSPSPMSESPPSSTKPHGRDAARMPDSLSEFFDPMVARGERAALRGPLTEFVGVALVVDFSALGERGFYLFDGQRDTHGLPPGPVLIGPTGVFSLTVRTSPHGPSVRKSGPPRPRRIAARRPPGLCGSPGRRVPRRAPRRHVAGPARRDGGRWASGQATGVDWRQISGFCTRIRMNFSRSTLLSPV